MKSVKFIEKLRLESNEELLQRFRNNDPKLVWVELYDKEIGASGVQQLANALRTNTTLQNLDLRSNNIGASGAQYLADALRTNTTLQVLDLSNNNISDSGAQHLADALRANTTLQELGLATNNIGASGAQYLADALRTNTTLQKLGLFCNKIDDSGAQYLADALRSNTTLQVLVLFLNKISKYIGEQHVEFINSRLEENKKRATSNASKDKENLELQQRFVTTQQQLQGKDMEISALQQRFAATQQQLQDKDRKNLELQQRLATTQQQLQDKDKHILELQQRLATTQQQQQQQDKEKEILELQQQQLATTQQQLEAQRTVSREQQGTIAALEQRLRQMERNALLDKHRREWLADIADPSDDRVVHVVRELGSGSFGTVDLVDVTIAPGTVHRLARKTMALHQNNDAALAAIEREVDSMKQLVHENLVQLRYFHVTEVDPRFRMRQCHLFMEAMDGNLSQLLMHNGDCTGNDGSLYSRVSDGAFRDQTVWLLQQCALPLEYLHDECNAVHRDIKPENVVVNVDHSTGTVSAAKLCDLGLAKQMHGTVHFSTALGTPGFVAPELMAGQSGTSMSDVFSYGVLMGCVLLRRRVSGHAELTSGRVPLLELVQQVHGGGSGMVQRQLERLVALCLKCLGAEPMHRPSMRDVVRDLTEAAAMQQQ